MDAGLAARIERFKKALAAFEVASDEEMAVEIAARVSQFAAPQMANWCDFSAR